MKHIHVTCAIIEKDGKVLSTQRSETMAMPLRWEFPGGKVEPNESMQTALTREIREELGAEIEVPLGVAAVLVGDLVGQGCLEVFESDGVEIELSAITRMIERVRAL